MRLCTLLMNLVYRVHWLKARARRDRCQEEVAIVRREMDSVCRAFHHWENEWQERARTSAVVDPDALHAGQAAYACRLSHMWSVMAKDAQLRFKEAQTPPNNPATARTIATCAVRDSGTI